MNKLNSHIVNLNVKEKIKIDIQIMFRHLVRKKHKYKKTKKNFF